MPMSKPASELAQHAIRPWYREPWPWVLIAIPLLTIIASAFTFWLAVSNPDYLVLDEQEYGKIKAELRADEQPSPAVVTPPSPGTAQPSGEDTGAGQAADESHGER